MITCEKRDRVRKISIFNSLVITKVFSIVVGRY
jgi:hypothetical protein